MTTGKDDPAVILYCAITCTTDRHDDDCVVGHRVNRIADALGGFTPENLAAAEKLLPAIEYEIVQALLAAGRNLRFHDEFPASRLITERARKLAAQRTPGVRGAA